MSILLHSRAAVKIFTSAYIPIIRGNICYAANRGIFSSQRFWQPCHQSAPAFRSAPRKWAFAFSSAKETDPTETTPEDDENPRAASQKDADAKRAAEKEQKKRERKERLQLVKQKRKQMLERSRGQQSPRAKPAASAPAPADAGAAPAAAKGATDSNTPKLSRKKEAQRELDQLEQIPDDDDDGADEAPAGRDRRGPVLTAEALAKMTPAERRSHLRRAKREAKEARALAQERRAAATQLEDEDESTEVPDFLQEVIQRQLARERARKAHISQPSTTV